MEKVNITTYEAQYAEEVRKLKNSELINFHKLNNRNFVKYTNNKEHRKKIAINIVCLEKELNRRYKILVKKVKTLQEKADLYDEMVEKEHRLSEAKKDEGIIKMGGDIDEGQQ